MGDLWTLGTASYVSIDPQVLSPGTSLTAFQLLLLISLPWILRDQTRLQSRLPGDAEYWLWDMGDWTQTQ